MAGLAVTERLIVHQTLTNNQQIQIDLPRDFIYVGLLLRFYGILNSAAGGGADGAGHSLNPWQYIRQILVDATGGGEAINLVNCNAFHAVRKSHLLRGIEPGRTVVAVGEGVADHPFSCAIPIWFIQPGSQVPSEIQQSTLLNPYRYSKLTLSVFPGAFTDFYVGGTRVHTWTAGPFLDVHALQAVNMTIKDKKLLNLPRSRFNFFLQDASAALGNAVRFTQAMPTGNRYRALYLHTFDNTAGLSTPVDDTLGQLVINLGPTQIRSYGDPLAIAHRNKEENMVGDAMNQTGYPASSTNENPAIGSYALDFMSGGRPQGLLDARNLPGVGIPVDVQRDITVAAARVWHVVTDEIVG